MSSNCKGLIRWKNENRLSGNYWGVSRRNEFDDLVIVLLVVGGREMRGTR